jgi:hypothetical protein
MIYQWVGILSYAISKVGILRYDISMGGDNWRISMDVAIKLGYIYGCYH